MTILLALAFFIKADTSPVEPGPMKFGSTTSVVLYDAPSKEDAEHWAKDFVQRRLLDGHSDQKLTGLKVLPIHDRLFTSTSDELIDWDAFVERVRATENYDDHPNEFGIGMLVKVKVKQSSSPATEAVPFDPDVLKKQLPNAERYNWDEKKQFYYVLYHDSKAFIVRAMNLFLCSQPYSLAMRGTTDNEQSIAVTTWPGAEKYDK